MARFLNRLFSTDGTAWVATAGYARIGYSSVSKELVDGVAHLLRRFGLRVKLRERQIAYKGTRRTAYEIEIMDAASLLAFCDEIGILGKATAREVHQLARRQGMRTLADAALLKVRNGISGLEEVMPYLADLQEPVSG